MISCVEAQGPAAALSYDLEPDSLHENSCAATIHNAGAPLLHRAVHDGTAAPDVTITELITLIIGITLATESLPEPDARAHRLFRLAITGLSPRP